MTEENTPELSETVSDNVEIIDHRTPAPQEGSNLEYPFDTVPVGTNVIEVAKGILWARMPLPWSLDHINVYLFDEGDSWSVVDTGSQGSRGIEAWEALDEAVLDGKPIKHVVATHMHPDHLGLAGWLVKKYDAKFSITMMEYMLAQHLWNGATDVFPEQEIQHLLKMGLNPDFEPMVRKSGFGFYKKGVHELPYCFERLEDGSLIALGGRQWRVIVGRGHSPEHACLLCLDEPLFIGGDQVLPEITSNVSVYAREPLANPLAHWLSSLERMKAVDGDPLVLPSHGPVFKGLHSRLEALIESHLSKLKRLHEWCSEEKRTPVETFPALYRRKIEGFDFFLALGEAVAHLHLLESVGLLSRSFDAGVYRFAAKGDIGETDMMLAIDKIPGVPLRSLHDIMN